MGSNVFRELSDTAVSTRSTYWLPSAPAVVQGLLGGHARHGEPERAADVIPGLSDVHVDNLGVGGPGMLTRLG